MRCALQQPEDEGLGKKDGGFLLLPACKTLGTTWEKEKDAVVLRGTKPEFTV